MRGVTQGLQPAGPEVRSAACFHTDQAQGHIAEKPHYLMALELFLLHRLPALIDPMDLKYVLGQIDADRRNLHRGRPRFV